MISQISSVLGPLGVRVTESSTVPSAYCASGPTASSQGPLTGSALSEAQRMPRYLIQNCLGLSDNSVDF